MMWNLPKRVRGHASLGWALAIAAVVAGGSAMAQPNKLQPRVDRSAQVVNQVGIDQRLNAQVPMDAEFRDEAGNPVRLGQLISQRPVILILAYYRCPMLCNEVMNGVVKALRVVPFEPAEDFDIVTISYGLRNLADFDRPRRRRVTCGPMATPAPRRDGTSSPASSPRLMRWRSR